MECQYSSPTSAEKTENYCSFNQETKKPSPSTTKERTNMSDLVAEDVPAELIRINCHVGVLEEKYKVMNERMSTETPWKIFQTSELHIRDIQHHYSAGLKIQI